MDFYEEEFYEDEEVLILAAVINDMETYQPTDQLSEADRQFRNTAVGAVILILIGAAMICIISLVT